ncbi:MAG: enoyl-CoA hydratase/isomerase family protein [Streptosporangiales bacterium]|nr:enoyl-CoA hydratase/isomerase family protein [Streptosporangiales bacterium]
MSTRPEAETATPLRERQEGRVLTVTLSREHVYNALNAELLTALDRCVASLRERPGVRAVVLTGAGGKAFSAGADLDELAGLPAEQARDLLGYGQGVLRRLETCGVPVIAAVNGVALGGGFEVALACSFIVAADTATFGLPEAGLGLMPGYGGTQRLPRLIGRHAALHLMLTGERLTAGRAYEIGLLPSPPVPPDELADRAAAAAGRVAERSPRSHELILEAVDAAADASVDAGLRHETSLAALAAVSADAEEGIAAFRERRRPRFGGPG